MNYKWNWGILFEVSPEGKGTYLEMLLSGLMWTLTTAFFAKLPYAMFFLLPAFAALTSLAYRRRGRAYTEHLLFALHMHAFAYLCLSAMVLIPGEGPVGTMLLVWWAYLALALRRVFGGRLIPQVLRSLPLLVGHSIVLVVVMLFALVAAVPAL